ncbi:MAG TPA: M20/M25/M40 family metallo-hydrolase [Gemmatimonadales bacterium]|nr:M20/M25/M40 family metallo-hydrolase [Gemmatimonadales bacterium]HRZ09655.1 M20/M25/M40 family metallo-hydrolase [Gemmatimonadales bacterium]
MRALLACLLLLLSNVPARAQGSKPPNFDALAAEATTWLQEYLRIRTVNPPGNETEGAKFLQAVLAREGITSEILESEPGRGNLVARLPGTGARRPLVLLSHIDVVPADSARWRYPPFSGVIAEGAVWGRGAQDTKGLGIIELATMVALKRRGVALSRDLILVANADEEKGSTGSVWFTTHHADLLRNAEFLLNEGGENRMGADGRTEYYGLDATEKVPYWVRLTVRGQPGHGSQPTPGNAALRLSRVLGRIADWQTPLVLTPPAEAYLKALATREANPTYRAWLAAPAAALKDSAAVAWLTADRYQNAILRNTVTITVLSGSTNTNVIPAEASAELDVRLLPGQRPEDFLAQLRAVIRDTTVEITPLSKLRAARSSPVQGPVLDALTDAVAAMDPGTLILPKMLTGYTDSYDYRALGIDAYGIESWRTTDEISATVHGNNERVPVPEVRFGVEFYYRIVEQLAR